MIKRCVEKLRGKWRQFVFEGLYLEGGILSLRELSLVFKKWVSCVVTVAHLPQAPPAPPRDRPLLESTYCNAKQIYVEQNTNNTIQIILNNVQRAIFNI